MRTTRKQLRDLVFRIARITEQDLYVNVAYGRPRVQRPAGAGYEDVSPRLPTGQLYEWCLAYLQGWGDGQSGIRKEVSSGAQ